ncbi:hypothetical protein DSO57_1015963 [Entomophthora muscae]|uniref:Uncharacterized protein n=1 Tax=Entomophthora muscae TaxID=34485 RepID=A0ACC2T5C8_9FUNG|nr:hypothetical protein DSO57_1015963 [Entomophthora muscae]
MTTPKKQSDKAKAPPKTPTPSPEPDKTSPTSPHYLFVYFPYDPQETLFDFSYHSYPIPEPEEKQKHQPKMVAPTDDKIELWDIHSCCNCAVLAELQRQND